jgi:hypothetical protein
MAKLVSMRYGYFYHDFENVRLQDLTPQETIRPANPLDFLALSAVKSLLFLMDAP